jgi:hypothetical protein
VGPAAPAAAWVAACSTIATSPSSRLCMLSRSAAPAATVEVARRCSSRSAGSCTPRLPVPQRFAGLLGLPHAPASVSAAATPPCAAKLSHQSSHLASCEARRRARICGSKNTQLQCSEQDGSAALSRADVSQCSGAPPGGRLQHTPALCPTRAAAAARTVLRAAPRSMRAMRPAGWRQLRCCCWHCQLPLRPGS